MKEVFRVACLSRRSVWDRCSRVRRAFRERTPSGMAVKHCIGYGKVTKSGLGLQGT